MKEPSALPTPLALLAVSLAIIAAVWWWLARPVTLAHAPLDPGAKLDCVSYAPFRGAQTPWNSDIVISPAQIAQDLNDLAKVSRCVRTYSVENGLDKVPELASRAGLKVILGIWIGRDRAKNAQIADAAVLLARDYPNAVSAVMVGSEVLLRGEMTAPDLREIIRSVRTRVKIPVSYADVWEFWLRYREVSADVDFVTIHMLPYWEDFPVLAEQAAAHVDDVRKRVATAFPDKEILIGEAGWPSRGRMRDGALPSRINQARFFSDLLERARQEKFRISPFEAYDEPWKRMFEGTVGGHWGLFDGDSRAPKYSDGAAISNYPNWPLQLGGGLMLSLAVFATAYLASRRRTSPTPLATWVAVALMATISGALLGIAAEATFYEGFGIGGWLIQGLLLAAAIAAPALCAEALVSRRCLPTFAELIGPREDRTRSIPVIGLGAMLIVTTVIATETALTLVFDARWRDFPFAALTMAVVPFWLLSRLNRAKSGPPQIAEIVFAGLFGLCTLYILFNEGFQNWQSLWTCAGFLLLGATLWQARSFAVAQVSPTRAKGLHRLDLLGAEAAIAPADVA
jgi:exo-beta-1,3-glucanase (GH17 family)